MGWTSMLLLQMIHCTMQTYAHAIADIYTAIAAVATKRALLDGDHGNLRKGAPSHAHNQYENLMNTNNVMPRCN